MHSHWATKNVTEDYAVNHLVFGLWGAQTGWKNYVSDEFYELFHVQLKQNSNWITYDENSIPGTKVDFLLFVEGYGAIIEHHQRLMEDPSVGKIALFCDDLHWHTPAQRVQKLTAFQLPEVIIFSTYPYLAHILYPELDTTSWFWTPHSASRRFAVPLNKTASSKKAILTGSTSESWYPNRAAAVNSNLARFKDSMIEVLPHPGYGKSNPREKEQFVKDIAAFSVSITSGSVLHYAVAKIFEIPAAGQLLLLDSDMKDVLLNLCFVPGVHYLHYTDLSLESTIKSAHRNLVRTLDMRMNAQMLVWAMHSTVARAKQLQTIAACLTSVPRQRTTSACSVWRHEGIHIKLSEKTIQTLERSAKGDVLHRSWQGPFFVSGIASRNMSGAGRGCIAEGYDRLCTYNDWKGHVGPAGATYCCRGPEPQNRTIDQQVLHSACPTHGKIPTQRVIVGIPTKARPHVGISYAMRTIDAYRNAMRERGRHSFINTKPATLIFDLNVFHASNQIVAEHEHIWYNKKMSQAHALSEVCKDEISSGFYCKQHILDSMPPLTLNGTPPQGIWRAISAGERQHNAHMLSILKALVVRCAGFNSTGSCTENFVLLSEDDFAPCPFFAEELQAVFFNSRIQSRNWLGLRISSGGSGFLVKCSDLWYLMMLFESWIEQGPVDSLLSWLLTYQPLGGPGSYVEKDGRQKKYLPSHQQRRAYLTYRYNMLTHFGEHSSTGNIYALETPKCRAPINSAGLISEEHFSSTCLKSGAVFSPCTYGMTSMTSTAQHGPAFEPHT
jgi:hypothetical protein